MFRESVISIPASGFYEWDKSKDKIYFTNTESNILYIAGVFNTFKGEERFVILTTAANSSVDKIHKRMPLLLTDNQLEDWVFNDSVTKEILSQVPNNSQRMTVRK